MATDRVNDPRAFRDFLDAKLSNEESGLTLDEALVHWEIENETEAERGETLEAIRRGFADIDAGRVRSLEDFDREFRQKHGLRPRA